MLRLGILERWLCRALASVAFASCVFCIVVSGCISDPNPIMQVVPETVQPPPNVTFQAPVAGYVEGSSPPSGTMFVHWPRSVADTQLNFKGYFLDLWKSDTVGSDGFGENLRTCLDSVEILRTPGKLTDTFYTFTSIPSVPSIPGSGGNGIPRGRYTVRVYGIKTGIAGDTILSVDSTEYSSLFDPLPLQNPTNLQATSTSPTTVLLKWTPSVTGQDTGFLQYVVYYRDTTLVPRDTGHVAVLVPKGDSEYNVPVPGSTIAGSTTPEWPYQFWVKSERIDSTFFYGPDLYGPDTNNVTWAGAQSVPQNGNDTAQFSGYLFVDSGQYLYFGSNNNEYDMVIDSNNIANGQILVTVANQTVTLTAEATGVGFLPNRFDPANAIDSIFYTTPLAIPLVQFTQKSISLPTNPASDSGVVVYFEMTDPSLNNEPEYVRLFIHAQPSNNEYFYRPSGNVNGIDIQGSFQPGVSKDGTEHLPFY